MPAEIGLDLIVRGELAFRPAGLDEAVQAADLLTACFPDRPADPILLRHAWANEHLEDVKERFLVLSGGEPAGLAQHRHPPWVKMPTRYGFVGADLLPEFLSRERLGVVYDFIEERSHATGTEIFNSRAREDSPLLVAFLLSRGYREDRLQKFWQLDLVGYRDRLLSMAEESHQRMRAQGIRVLTLDEDTDPDRYRQLYTLSTEADEDIPTTVPFVPVSFEEFMRWIGSPGLRGDRIWIARSGANLAGVSMLAYPPVRGMVVTDWTATARTLRGRGVARALKLATLVQAIALGVTSVQTDNDFQNAPILHVNEQLGYGRIPGWRSFLKPAAAPAGTKGA